MYLFYFISIPMSRVHEADVSETFLQSAILGSLFQLLAFALMIQAVQMKLTYVTHFRSGFRYVGYTHPVGFGYVSL